MRDKIDEVIKESHIEKYDDELKENTCCICMFNKPNILLKCHETYGHKFCINCIKENDKIRETCPLCRGEYSDIIWIV